MPKVIPVPKAERQRATILAALRFYQRELITPGVRDFAIEDIATDGGTLTALNCDEIDLLCEVINTSR